VLLTVACLARRADAVDVIGSALRMKAEGVGHRSIAAALGRAPTTVRGWLRAFAVNAETVRGVCMRLLFLLDPLAGPLLVRGGRVADAVGAVAAAARRRLGLLGAVSPWQSVSALTCGVLLAPGVTVELINTSRPLAPGW
jgi:hypothetical protein